MACLKFKHSLALLVLATLGGCSPAETDSYLSSLDTIESDFRAALSVVTARVNESDVNTREALEQTEQLVVSAHDAAEAALLAGQAVRAEWQSWEEKTEADKIESAAQAAGGIASLFGPEGVAIGGLITTIGGLWAGHKRGRTRGVATLARNIDDSKTTDTVGNTVLDTDRLRKLNQASGIQTDVAAGRK
jgi:ribosomal protein L12E/L44/L45/RPP1/RPP2